MYFIDLCDLYRTYIVSNNLTVFFFENFNSVKLECQASKKITLEFIINNLLRWTNGITIYADLIF
ncbi:hypothetical protein Bca4012_027393 [Brassica carinata]